MTLVAEERDRAAIAIDTVADTDIEGTITDNKLWAQSLGLEKAGHEQPTKVVRIVRAMHQKEYHPLMSLRWRRSERAREQIREELMVRFRVEHLTDTRATHRPVHRRNKKAEETRPDKQHQQRIEEPLEPETRPVGCR